MSKKSARGCGAKHFSMLKAPHARTTFEGSDLVLRGRCRGLWTSSYVSEAWGFVAVSTPMAGVGHLKRICKDTCFRRRHNTRDMFIRAVRKSGRWFPERGCILEPQIFRFAEMILRDRCSTSYDLASLFRGRRSSLDKWTGKIAKRIGTRPSALHSTFHFWRKSRRIASFDVVKVKIEEVSQDCFVLDLSSFKNWGSLAELLRFQACR